MAKILMVVAPKNYQNLEYDIPKKLFEENGHQVFTASTVENPEGYTGGTTADVLLKNANQSNYDVLVFAGGSGSHTYFDDKKAQSLAKDFYEAGKLTCAICSSVSVFANAGILKGKKSTCFIDQAENLKAKGAIYTGQPMEQDEKVITGNGPSASETFAKTIIKALKNPQQ